MKGFVATGEAKHRRNTAFFICFDGCSAAFAVSLHPYHCIFILSYIKDLNMTIFDSMLVLGILLIMFVFPRDDRPRWKL